MWVATPGGEENRAVFNRDTAALYMQVAVIDFIDWRTDEVKLAALADDAACALGGDDELYYELAHELWETGELW